MKKIFVPLFVLGLLVAGGTLSCQSRIPNRNPVGEILPSVKGESLTGEAWNLPQDLAGEPALLLVGYVQKAQFDADRWILGALQSGAAVRLLEIPTIPGLVPTMISGTIDEGMRRGIPVEDQAGVVTVYGSEAQKLAEFTGTEVPTNMRALLLDRAGRVVWFHDAGYSPRELLEASSIIEGLD